MRGGLYIAVAAVLGALLANLLLADSGYVALRFAGRLIEMSAVTFVLLLIVAYFVVRAISRAISARQLWRRNQEQRRLERARRSLGQGLLDLSAGEYEAAEKTLTRYARDAENPVAHYLVAARAADLQGAGQRRDELLARALEASTDQRAPVLIMQAEIHLKHKQLASALATLEQLEASGESNARGLLLLSRVHRQTGAWQRLLEIEPRLRSTRGIPPAVADETVAQIYLDRLKAAGAAADPTQLASAWKDIPKTLARRADIVVAYARAAMACDEQESAEGELRDSIERAWDESTVLTYGEVEQGSGGALRQKIGLQQGIPIERAKEIVRMIKDSKVRVQASIQEDQVRVAGKNRDDLQKIIALLKDKDLGIALQFTNYRST